MSLLLVAAVDPVLDTILHYLEDGASQIEGICLQRTSRFFQKLFEHRFRRIRCAKQNKPYICYELYHSLMSSDYPAGTFQLVDSLALPVSNGEHPSLISLPMQQQQMLLDCKPRVAYLSEHVGWGVKSSTVIPKSRLLFAYYGEFISTREATKRHALNAKSQVRDCFFWNCSLRWRHDWSLCKSPSHYFRQWITYSPFGSTFLPVKRVEVACWYPILMQANKEALPG